MTRHVLLLAVLVLTGCGHQVRQVQVRVAVPVECREPVPVRPPMPTDLLDVDATLDEQVQAMTAEIDRREAYEIVLVAALRVCTASVTPALQN